MYCEIMTRTLGRGHAQQQGWYMMMRAKRRISPSCHHQLFKHAPLIMSLSVGKSRLVFKHPGQAIELDMEFAHDGVEEPPPVHSDAPGSWGQPEAADQLVAGHSRWHGVTG